MKEYKIEIHFTDVDDNFYTKGRVKMKFDVEADDYGTAYHLGQRLCRSFGGDAIVVNEPPERIQVTAEMVSHLRDKTDCPMMECKNALIECGGDMNKAMDWLRTPAMLRKWSVNKEYYDS